MNKRISITILTKDSEKYLSKCLDSLIIFDEVLILDNGSRDSTLEIASRYSNVTIKQHPFIGFGPMKNLAANMARNDWILTIDSDEIVSSKLVDEICQLNLESTNHIYAIKRINHYNGKPVHCCGWYPDIVLRLYNRTHTRYNEAMVHESLQLQSGSRHFELAGLLYHYPFDDVASLIEKMQSYSTLYARQSDKSSSPAKAFFRALFAFFKNYFLQRGFLCGYPGLLISVSNANGVFYKYMKLYEKREKERR